MREHERKRKDQDLERQSPSIERGERSHRGNQPGSGESEREMDRSRSEVERERSRREGVEKLDE
ncbi:MAG TPA: hypothetical protein VMT16_04685 [Thermoanaerobaculia bacterium]|nr:hypothetical protein [Thermoanaerobaculia bacterium]